MSAALFTFSILSSHSLSFRILQIPSYSIHLVLSGSFFSLNLCFLYQGQHLLVLVLSYETGQPQGGKGITGLYGQKYRCKNLVSDFFHYVLDICQSSGCIGNLPTVGASCLMHVALHAMCLGNQCAWAFCIRPHIDHLIQEVKIAVVRHPKNKAAHCHERTNRPPN